MFRKSFRKILLSTFATAFFISSAQAAPMTLNVNNSNLQSTIMLVAQTGGLNVSVDDSVQGEISIAVKDLEPIQVLEIIAKTKNLNLVCESGTFIMTANFNSSAMMQSYILPVRYGDAEILKNAAVMSLDAEFEEESKDLKRDEEIYRRGNKDFDREVYSNKKKVISRADRVMINSDTNSLILFGTAAEYERVKKLLESLDVELKQVSVEAKILAIDKAASKNLGVEWFWSTAPQYPERDIDYTSPTYNSNGTERTPGYYEEEYTRKANDNTGYGIIHFGRGPEGIPFEWYYGARINALVTDGKAKILSRPNVTTIQGREAIINVGSSVPIPRYETTNSTTTTSMEYRDAGIILKYTPRVNSDGTITATIHTEVSTPQYVADLKAYRFNTRSADTVVTLRDGEPMVIGGLIGSEESKNVSKIPFLGDLPILGSLFKNHQKSKSDSELMIFLTAHVLGGEKNVPDKP